MDSGNKKNEEEEKRGKKWQKVVERKSGEEGEREKENLKKSLKRAQNSCSTYPMPRQ